MRNTRRIPTPQGDPPALWIESCSGKGTNNRRRSSLRDSQWTARRRSTGNTMRMSFT
ncbi:hypothetical protein SOVF_103100 [Spinacia oleracea]|nr:hypothetical protein SOVF_103100 [Spinacia oleracea]